jgi:hypothetical protein
MIERSPWRAAIPMLTGTGGLYLAGAVWMR